MSIDNGLSKIGEKEFARRNLWEATFLDENHKDLVWSTGLIKSINIPKLTFTVEDIYAGTAKGYTGWKLPDNLSISIWETSDHTVEKYLDEWMLGETGVFNTGSKDGKGARFRTQRSVNYLYRDVRIKTFIYEYPKSESYAVSEVLEIRQMQEIATVDKKQVIPGLDKITAAVSGLTNQAVARIPGSDLTRKFIPPVVIPPPLLQIPVMTGTPFPQTLTKARKMNKFPVFQSSELSEKITSLITYTTAIEGYDIGTYDYATGDGVSYTVNLAVQDIKIEYPT